MSGFETECLFLMYICLMLFPQCIVTKPDGTPAPGELIELTIADNSRGAGPSTIYNHTTDQSGQFYFEIPPFQPNTESFNIQVSALNLYISIK